MCINNEESGLPTVWINECDYYQVNVEDCGVSVSKQYSTLWY